MHFILCSLLGQQLLNRILQFICTVSANIFIFTGGTFALYSLLCRHAKVSTIPNQHKTDEELTTYSRQTYEENSLAAKVKRWLEQHAYRRNCLLILVLIGTCTAIGDGILTPAISGI
jgi:KUP system potassium uptake protein